MAAPNIGRRSRSLSPLAAGFVVIGLVSLGLAARAQDRSANDEAIAALADIEPAIGELTASSDLMANTGRPYKQAAQRAAAAVAGALGRLDWLTDHAGGNVWGLGVEGSRVNSGLPKATSTRRRGPTGWNNFGQRHPARCRLRESTVGVLGGLRGALATTTLGIPADATTVSGCGLPAKAPAYGVIDGLAPAQIQFKYADTSLVQIWTGAGGATVRVDATAVPTVVVGNGPLAVNVGFNGSLADIGGNLSISNRNGLTAVDR
jgi:hypothetical protein